MGYSPKGPKESDTTERFHFHFPVCKALGQKLWRELGNSPYLKEVSVEEGKRNVYAIHPSKVILSLSVIFCGVA